MPPAKFLRFSFKNFIIVLMKRILTGVKPTGAPHIGNYFGAMKPMVDLVNSGEYEAFVFIADIHALNFIQDKKKMEEMIHNLVLDYLAIGLDSDKVILFKQSDIPEHTELAWFLNTLISVPFLMRGHSYKDAKQKGELEKFSMGDFTYPILMAADILLYEPDFVPVGKDQKQHLEFARDFAQKFNFKFGETFKLPEPLISDEVGTVPGTDGRKMSKSYGNTIPLFASDEEIRKIVRKIPTDSKLLEEPKNPDEYNLYKIFKLFATPEDDKIVREMFQKGGYTYGEIKDKISDTIINFVKPMREKREEFSKDPEMVKIIVIEGTQKARKIAQEKIKEVKEKVGMVI